MLKDQIGGYLHFAVTDGGWGSNPAAKVKLAEFAVDDSVPGTVFDPDMQQTYRWHLVRSRLTGSHRQDRAGPGSQHQMLLAELAPCHEEE